MWLENFVKLLKNYLWTLEALDTAFLLALSMPAWMEAIIFPSGPFKMSSTVVISGRPWDWHHSMAVGVNLFVGVSSSIWQKRKIGLLLIFVCWNFSFCNFSIRCTLNCLIGGEALINGEDWIFQPLAVLCREWNFSFITWKTRAGWNYLLKVFESLMKQSAIHRD